MNSLNITSRRLFGCGLLMLLMAAAGCATNKIDWTSRVGVYSFDQAVLDMGPPAKQAKLEDGTVVADWLTRRGYVEPYPAPYYYGYRYRPYGPAYVAPVMTSTPNVYLRLTFSPDSKLADWKRVYE